MPLKETLFLNKAKHLVEGGVGGGVVSGTTKISVCLLFFIWILRPLLGVENPSLGSMEGSQFSKKIDE